MSHEAHALLPQRKPGRGSTPNQTGHLAFCPFAAKQRALLRSAMSVAARTLAPATTVRSVPLSSDQ